jgi:hypothetical protein
MPATNTTACPKGPLARRVDAPAVVLCNAPKTPCWNGVLPAAPLLMHALMSPRLWPFLALYALLGTPMLHAAEPVSDILSTGAQSAEAGQAAQAEVDRLATETSTLVDEYTAITRQIEGLGIHNARLERQFEDQQKRLADLDAAAEGALVLQREIAPLLQRMVDSLEQFVTLDLPFRLPERKARVAALRHALESADTPIDIAFRDVLLAYRAELDYARHIGTYSDTITVNGQPRGVQVLHVGRSLLLARTPDGSADFRWDPDVNAWALLESGYDADIARGIAMAGAEAPPALLRLPLPAVAETKP